ncbi:hypothetical protein NX722_08330 [Endozoicomonas gorgoniicola]|uniref:Uncharacterized protein n=1 Tax=Endozoicomonas gorgoniicola TaxID=1234144 RepID=A0ABT3MTD8_9GAMM|nr:hypothetical protein [Endozoicomonas gorgoniicola]MCW7552652.1 hypothetical protein [Endozoicomonas gorgoniicola]
MSFRNDITGYYRSIRQFVKSIEHLEGAEVYEVHDLLGLESRQRDDGGYWREKYLVLVNENTLADIRPSIDDIKLASIELRSCLNKKTRSCLPPRVVTGLSGVRPRASKAIQSIRADKDVVLKTLDKVLSRHSECIKDQKKFDEMVEAVNIHSFEGLRVIRHTGYSFKIDYFEDDYKTGDDNFGTIVVASGYSIPKVMKWRPRQERSDKKKWQPLFDFDELISYVPNLPIGSGHVIYEESS